MSMELMVAALKVKVGNHGRKLVLIKLADNANDRGECWPSYQHVADQCEMGRSTVKAHIKQLADDGFIKIEARNDGKSSNRYRLTIDKGISKPKQARTTTKTRSESDPVETRPSQNSAHTRSESDPLTRSDSDPRTSHSFEPVIEPVTPPATEQPVDRFALDTSNLAVSKPTDNRNRFEMRWDWLPTDSLIDRCRMMGVDLSTMSDEEKEIELGEFKSYWLSAGDKYNQGQWEHKFAQRLKHQLARRASADQPTKGDLRAAVTESIMDVADTDW